MKSYLKYISWAVSVVILSFVALLYQQAKAQLDENTDTIQEHIQDVVKLKSTVTAIPEVTEEKINTVKSVIEERSKATDAKLNTFNAQLDRVEAKVDILLSRTPPK